MNETLKQYLYWEIKNNFYDLRPVLNGFEGEKPRYISNSLLDNYGVTSTDDTKIIFEEATKDFKIKDEDKPYLWKLLTDFSIEKFLNNEQDPGFLGFLQYYDFYIKVCVNHMYL